MTQWVIYKHPREYPDRYVLREWHIDEGDPNPRMGSRIELADELEEIRLFVPEGCVCLTRSEDDDPSIVEVWL